MTLSRRVQQWAIACGIDGFSLNKMMNAATETAAEAVGVEMDRVIDSVRAKSLTGYKAVVDKALIPTTIKIQGGPTLTLYRYAVYVKASDAHFGLGLNVFDILDGGRKELADNQVHPMWNFTGIHKIPAKSVRSTLTGRFSYRNDAAPTRKSPRRSEPRKGVREKRVKSKDFPGFFIYASTEKPIKAMPARNLYARIYKNAQKSISKLGFDPSLISVAKKDPRFIAKKKG